jgi:hypothetical protein
VVKCLKGILFLLFGLEHLACLSAKEASIPFEYYQRVIFLNVQINNSDSLLFLFDTGANASAIDEKTADKLKLSVLRSDSVEGSAGTILVQMVKINSIRAGNAGVTNLEFTKQNLSYSLAPPGKHVDGILGTDFMKHFIVTIDFKNHEISFSKKIKNNTKPIPFLMDTNIPKMKATVNDSFQTFLRYDSGSSLFATDSTYINVTINDWITIQQLDSSLKPCGYFSGIGTGGEIKLAVVPVKSLSFNGQQIQNPFIIVQPKQGYFARTDAVGFFGNNLLDKYHRVIIDFFDDKMYLLKSKNK